MAIKRKQIQHFLNINPDYPHELESANALYAVIGPGVPNSETDYGPKTTEETYIADDSASISTDGYEPSMGVEQTALLNDPVFDFVDQLRLDGAVEGEAETDVVNVWMYKAGGPTAFPAEQQKVSIAVEDIGDEGGKPLKINYKTNYIGTPVPGTWNNSTKVFTAT